MRRFYPLVLALCVSWSGVATAQITPRTRQIMAASELPVSAARARREGVPDREVRGALDAMRAAKVPAHEARDVIDQERAARREHGPVDNFGAFVQSRLQAGLRGRQLAAAIKAEHVARGKGRAGGAQKAGGRSVTARDTTKAGGQKAARPTGRAAADTKRPATKTDTKRPATKTDTKRPATKAPAAKRPDAKAADTKRLDAKSRPVRPSR